MKLKSLITITLLGVSGFAAQADSSQVRQVREVLPSATFSSMLDKGFMEQARFFLPSVLAMEESTAGSPAKQRETVSDAEASLPEAANTSLENLAMLMAGLGVVGFVAGRRKSG